MNDFFQPIFNLAEPLTSALLALLAVLTILWLRRRAWSRRARVAAFALVVVVFFSGYYLLRQTPAGARWLAAMNTPFAAIFLTVVLPAMHLPRNKWYRLFLVWPALLAALAVVSIVEAYGSVPEESRGFYWILIRPVWLISGITALLVLIQPMLRLATFRTVVRGTCLAILVYGGFALRHSYDDYRTMLARRKDAVADMMLIAETSPVMQNDNRLAYLPSAPCRFTADGGYVQGCNLEMLQRLMQVNLGAVARRDPSAIGALSVILGAAAVFLAFCFATGRAACGWLCPLSTLGDILNWFRRRLRLPHYKPAQPIKLTVLFSGLGLAGVALAMAKAYPHLDADGKFAGCKIPLYPFCKICPSQQVCPLAAHGISGYAGLPTWDWGFGFFRAACMGLLAFFALAFVTSRRLWCRFCPMGMIAGLFNRGGMFRLAKDPDKCNQCGVCADVCPMDIDLVRSEMTDENVSSFDCVLCLKCVEKCPRDTCLSLEHAGATVAESHYEP